MFLGIVRGHVVSTIHHPFYTGKKLLLVDRSNEHFQSTGKYVLAIDAIGAGVGQRVLVLDEGTGARQLVDDPAAPLRSIIVGIVDDVTFSA